MVPLSGMGSCPNIQCGKAGGTWNPVKMSSDLVHQGVGCAKTSAFLVFAGGSKFIKEIKFIKDIGFLQFLP